jgi:hypothetical protein
MKEIVRNAIKYDVSEQAQIEVEKFLLGKLPKRQHTDEAEDDTEENEKSDKTNEKLLAEYQTFLEHAIRCHVGELVVRTSKCVVDLRKVRKPRSS